MYFQYDFKLHLDTRNSVSSLESVQVFLFFLYLPPFPLFFTLEVIPLN